MQEVTIVTKVDNQQAINAQVGLRKEIKNLKLELESLNKGTEEYINTLNLLIQKVEIYKEKMNSIKNSSSQFSDITINNTKILQGLGEGFKDATTNIELYIKAEGELQSNLDKITNASLSSNRLYNVKGSVDNSQEEALKKQAIAAEQANKALIGNSNTQAGLAAATAATNNASSLQGNELIKNTTIVNENVVAQENLDRALITATGSFREQLFEIKNNSAELAKFAEEKRSIKDYTEEQIQYNKEQIATLKEKNRETELFRNVLIDIKGEMKSTSSGIDLFPDARSIDKIIDKYTKTIPEKVESIKKYINSIQSDDIIGLSINDIKKNITELGVSLDTAKGKINEYNISITELKEKKSQLTGEINKIVNAQDSLNERLKTSKDNTVKDNKTKVDAANASSELQKRNTMLAFSMAQIIREAPVMTMSLDMFFLAISNNLPMLSDQIKAMKAYNKTLVEAGKSAEQVNIWKAVGKSLLSFNSLMMVGITLLTAFGSDIWKFTKTLFENTEEIERNKKKTEERNKQLELSSDAAKNAASEYATLNLMYKQWNNIKGDSLSIRQKWFNAHKETLAKTGKGYKDLKSLERDWAVNGIKEYQEGIKKRALATAAFTKLTELYEKRLKLTDKVREKDLIANQNYYNKLLDEQKKASDLVQKYGAENPAAESFAYKYVLATKKVRDYNEAIKEGQVSTVESNKEVIDNIDKQIENYSKLADIKDNVIKQDTTRIENQIDKDRESIINLTTGLEKVNEDWYTSLKSINDEWIEEEKNKWLKGEQLESDYIKQKTQFIITSTNLEKLKAKDELRINNDLAKKGYDDEVKKLTEKEVVFKKHLNKYGKLNNEDKKLLEDLNNSKKLLEENYNKTVLNNETKFNVTIKALERTAKNEEIENTVEYYNTLLKENDRYNESISNEMSTIFNDTKSNFANKQDVNLLSTLFNFNPDALEKQLAEITNKITEAQNNIKEGTSNKDILDKELNDILTTAKRREEIEAELTKIKKEQSDARLIIDEAEAEKRKAINENMMAILEGSLQSTSSVFQAVIDNNDASYEEAEKRYQQQLESGKITKDQYDKEILAAQQKQNEKNKKWQAGIAMIDGINGAVKALSGAMSLGPIAGPIVGGVQAAAIIASTVASIRKIYAQKVSDTGGSGGSVSSSSVADISAPLIYSANVTTQSQEEKLNQPIKVYVTESDITNVQNKVRVSESEATF